MLHARKVKKKNAHVILPFLAAFRGSQAPENANGLERSKGGTKYTAAFFRMPHHLIYALHAQMLPFTLEALPPSKYITPVLHYTLEGRKGNDAFAEVEHRS